MKKNFRCKYLCLPKSSRNFLYRLLLSIASDEMFAKYSSKVTQEELHKVCVNLYEKLTGKKDFYG